jgi:hypothetical protein
VGYVLAGGGYLPASLGQVTVEMINPESNIVGDVLLDQLATWS